ncbi:MAG: hypothetical protein IPK13_10245 [Deltaproteobacteria bacterium]|nr:hypothetical protein [Deltaproteobacteria bacterium]
MVDARIGKVRAGLDRYFQAFEDGDMDPTLCRERIEGLRAQQKQLEEEREGLVRQAEQAELGVADDACIEAFGRDFDRIMGGAPACQRKHLIKGLVPRVVVFSREEIDVYLRVPVTPVRVTGSLAPQAEPFANALRVSNRDRFADSHRPRKPFALRTRQVARGALGHVRRIATSRHDCGGRA